jgi:hypothetical protein
MSPMRRWCSAGVGLLSLVWGCGDSDGRDPSGAGGNSGGTASGGRSGSAGKAGAGSGGSGKGGSSTGSGGSAADAGRGGSGTGKGGTSSAGSSSGEGAGGGTSGASGEASGGTAGSGGSGGAPTPGECGAVATFADGLTPTREIFVDAEAAGPGAGSAEDPYTTIEAALDDVTPGSAVRIRPGSYAGGAFVSDLQGSAEAPIWIGGVPGEARPVITGGSNAIQLSAAVYVILHDLEITGQTSNGINVDDAETGSGRTQHLVFQNLLIHDIGDGGNQDCLKLSGVDEFFVLGSEFRGCSGGSAIDHVGCHNGVVARNTFRDLGGNGVQSKGGSRNIEIRQNHFLNAGERAVNMGGSTGFEFFRPTLSVSGINFEASEISVVGNVFRGGISPIAFVGCVRCVAANNTIVDPEHWVVRILQETTSTAEYAFAPASDGRFVNNAVYYALGDLSTHVNVGADTDPESFEFSNNLWYAYDSPSDSEPSSLPVAETNGVYGEDPAFAAAENDDYAIGQDSPAAGAGVAVDGVTGDVNGDCYAEPPSIGAYEAQ